MNKESLIRENERLKQENDRLRSVLLKIYEIVYPNSENKEGKQ